VSYAEHLHELRDELGLEDDALFLQGDVPIPDRDLASLFVLADALFFPSRQEGFGLPVLEAAVHRLPAFCSAIEPLTTLLSQGVTFFPIDAEPIQIAMTIAARLGTTEAWQARHQIRRHYAWPAVYANHLAPLLAEFETPVPA
jgi:glycosyltransferase involved in cell wall biosynthesis